MAPLSLLRAWATGLTLTVRDGALVVRPKAGISPALRAGLRADKAALLATLTTPTLHLNAALAYAVADLPTTAADVRDWLAPEDWEDLHAGRIGPSQMRAIVESRLGLRGETKKSDRSLAWKSVRLSARGTVRTVTFASCGRIRGGRRSFAQRDYPDGMSSEGSASDSDSLGVLLKRSYTMAKKRTNG